MRPAGTHYRVAAGVRQSSAPEGRKNVAHGVSRGNRTAPMPPQHFPSPGGAKEGRKRGPRSGLRPRTFCRPSGAYTWGGGIAGSFPVAPPGLKTGRILVRSPFDFWVYTNPPTFRIIHSAVIRTTNRAKKA